jgi:hypothetical protein
VLRYKVTKECEGMASMSALAVNIKDCFPWCQIHEDIYD